MNIPVLKRFTIALGVLFAVLLVGSGYLLWRYGHLQLQAAFAEEQTRIFEEMRTQALQSAAPHSIAGSLEYVVTYYPSGTKQSVESRLDRVVERHRTAAVRDIIAHLRRTTGEDLGEAPEPWIQKYGRR